MLKDSKLFDDMAKMATSAAGTVMDMKREVEAMVNARVESYLARTSLVTREEFEVVRAMAEKARSENEALKREIEALKAPKSKKSS
ncbi:MAG: pyrroline-5-carboxylate reductase [Alphaproteobacteria bacterium]|nr:pyrroline-5-carboxylate reductase [Alphaproteobacteria bacterium]